MSVYNKKDIIGINQEVGESGDFNNESSLDFSLSIIKDKKSWLFELSYIIRCLLIDHAFRDGNKRTAFILSTLYFDESAVNYDKDKLVNLLHKIAKNNINDINKIIRELRKCWT